MFASEVSGDQKTTTKKNRVDSFPLDVYKIQETMLRGLSNQAQSLTSLQEGLDSQIEAIQCEAFMLDLPLWVPYKYPHGPKTNTSG